MHTLQESGVKITEDMRRLPQATFWRREEKMMEFHFPREFDCFELKRFISTDTEAPSPISSC